MLYLSENNTLIEDMELLDTEFKNILKGRADTIQTPFTSSSTPLYTQEPQLRRHERKDSSLRLRVLIIGDHSVKYSLKCIS